MRKGYALLTSIISFVLIGMLLMTGCTKKDDSGQGNGELSPATLKMVYPVAANATADQQIVTEAINVYLKEKLNVTLNIEALDGSTFYQKLPVMISSGENFDISWINTGTLLQNVSRNAFVQMDDLLDEYGADIKKLLPEMAMDGVRVNGKLYALPVYKEYAYGNTYYARKDIVDKYNIDLGSIKTLRDFEPYLAAIKQGESRMAPYFIQNGAMDAYMPASQGEKRYFEVAGLPDVICYDPETDAFYNKVETESYKNRNKIIYEWNQKGYINKDALTVQANFEETIKGDKGWFVTSSSKPGMEQSLSKTTGTEIIRGYSEKSYVKTTSLMGSMNTISITSRNPERAMMLLNLLYTDKELINLFNFGIEGKHYNKVSDNTIKLPDGINMPSDTGYAPGIDWRIGNNFNLYIWDYEPQDKWEQYHKFNEEALPEPLLGFFMDTTPVKNQISSINNIRSEYHLPLWVGTTEPEAFMVRYSQKLKEAGIDEVIAETQKQYETWKQTKR